MKIILQPSDYYLFIFSIRVLNSRLSDYEFSILPTSLEIQILASADVVWGACGWKIARFIHVPLKNVLRVEDTWNPKSVVITEL